LIQDTVVVDFHPTVDNVSELKVRTWTDPCRRIYLGVEAVASWQLPVCSLALSMTLAVFLNLSSQQTEPAVELTGMGMIQLMVMERGKRVSVLLGCSGIGVGRMKKKLEDWKGLFT
jgi:hypothetical protein